MTSRGERDHIDDELRHEIAALRAALHDALDGWTSWRTYYLDKTKAERGVDFTLASEVQDEADTLTRLRLLAGTRPGKEA